MAKIQKNFQTCIVSDIYFYHRSRAFILLSNHILFTHSCHCYLLLLIMLNFRVNLIIRWGLFWVSQRAGRK
jgi:hypothetical protein